MLYKTECSQCVSTGGDTSRDNLVNYEDGGKHCFACGYHVNGSGFESKLADVGTDITYCGTVLVGEYEALSDRKISKEICNHFDYSIGVDNSSVKWSWGTNVHISNYYIHGEVSGQKIRNVTKKDFYTILDASSLFGMQLYAPSDKVFITITEGEIDALSIAQQQGKQYPVVSVPNGAEGAERAIKKHLQYLKGFKHVVLCFDQDEPGQKAARDCSKLFDPGFCRIAKLPLKDASEMLVAGRGGEITNCLFNAQSVRPDGVISFDEITEEELLELFEPGISICFPKLSNMLNGLQRQSLYTLVAKAKAGKTTVTKEIVSYLAKQGHHIGMLYLEERPAKEIASFIAMEEQEPYHRYSSRLQSLSDENKLVQVKQLKTKINEYNKGKNLTIYNHKGVLDAESIYNTISYMVVCMGCRIIVLDNISIAIAGSDAALNERKLIDKIVFDLVKLINNTGCTILTVVHVNQKGEEDGKVTRRDVFGSGAFIKFSTALIAVNRVGCNTVQLEVLGNRTTGQEGDADMLLYNPSTGRLELTEEVI